MYESQDRKLIFVFTGPDGSGRKTVAYTAGQTLGIPKVISYATREPRPGEVNGQDYHFISDALYDQLEEQDEFLESVTIGTHRYGIREYDIEQSIQANGRVYVVLNRDGAEILKGMYGDRVVRICIYADRETVTERQRGIGLPEDVIESHLAHYDYDMAYQAACELAYENYDLAYTVHDLTKTLEGYLNRNLVERD
ncbi:guanylate kinase [Paenibacillus darwinianus]|uniref:Guanylate kinase n=1 Tax=Paenibacillus darwinianus TaxID=1380763 RepID=A0A9W5W5Y8_9BACL|nr:guanylate kinase [Paenibacillus darwinianus]EXX84545.1 guanylate kinase [Paenibacillus darwinianus]EXX84577.1 guanylate kinase [Paenibacillus darwinianus]EXX84580.1 guanylate kinase [Paenibacillus darwinianus]